jgi:pectate lyase
VTIHHNLFAEVGQRAPRVRYGQVDLYNNHYRIRQQSSVPFVYSLGVGVSSHLYAEANAFSLARGIPVASLIQVYGGTELVTVRNTVNGRRVNLLAAYNRSVPAEEQLRRDTSWRPTLRRHVDPPRVVPRVVDRGAGPLFRTGR